MRAPLLFGVVVGTWACASCGSGEGTGVDSRERVPREPPASSRAAGEPAGPDEATPPAATSPAAIALRDPALNDRYGRARACIVRLAAEPAWTHRPAEGAAVREERWCSMDGPCVATGRGFPLGQRSFHLRTMSGDGATANDERLELVARDTSGSGWLTTARLQPWTGGFSFELARGAVEYTIQAEQCVAAMDRNICASADDPVLPVLDWHDREVRAYTSSAESLRDRALVGLERLRAAIERAVAAHTLSTCDDPDSPGRWEHVQGAEATGIADTCPRRTLTRPEERAVLTEARREIRHREALVRRHHAEWHAAIAALFPFEDCWLPPGAGAPRNTEAR